MSLTFAAAIASDDAAGLSAMGEICELLSADVGQEVLPLTPSDPLELARLHGEGQASFTWISPTLLFLSRDLDHAVPLLSSMRRGLAFFHSVLFCRADAPYRCLGDLHSVRAAWVAETSSSGYLVTRLALKRQGVDLASAFATNTFFGTHRAVAVAVMDGRADVGSTFANFGDGDVAGGLRHAGFHDVAGSDGARILDVGGPIPADMIVAHPDVPIRDRINFAAAMSRLPSDPVGGVPIRRVMGADGFAPVLHDALLELQELLAAAD